MAKFIRLTNATSYVDVMHKHPIVHDEVILNVDTIEAACRQGEEYVITALLSFWIAKGEDSFPITEQSRVDYYVSKEDYENAKKELIDDDGPQMLLPRY